MMEAYMTIEELEISLRKYTILKRAGINSLEDLCIKSTENLLSLKCTMKKKLAEVNQILVGINKSLSNM